MAANDAAVLIPIRSFSDAKSRLAAALNHSDRTRLTVAMAERVMTAAGNLPVTVVSDDPDVNTWAESSGASVFHPGVLGLNAAMSAAVDHMRSEVEAPDRLIIAHADLPLASDLSAVAGPGVALAPDLRRDGTNVLSLPTNAEFTFRYGPGSFDAHIGEARNRGLEVTVIDDPSLALDIDDPSDLRHLELEQS